MQNLSSRIVSSGGCDWAWKCGRKCAISTTARPQGAVGREDADESVIIPRRVTSICRRHCYRVGCKILDGREKRDHPTARNHAKHSPGNAGGSAGDASGFLSGLAAVATLSAATVTTVALPSASTVFVEIAPPFSSAAASMLTTLLISAIAENLRVVLGAALGAPLAGDGVTADPKNLQSWHARVARGAPRIRPVHVARKSLENRLARFMARAQY